MSNGYSTWLEIDLEAIRKNIRSISQIADTPIMAVVKANGYGHGAVETARAALEAGASWFGVARFEEAMALRKAGIQNHVLVLGYTPPECVVDASKEKISLTVHDHEIGRQYLEQLEGQTGILKIHVKVDTGMGRLGVRPEDAIPLLEDLQNHPGMVVEGFCTHFAKADEQDRSPTEEQLSRFIPLVEELEKRDLRPEYVHAANSAACLRFPESRFDLIRPGIAVYGLHPSKEVLLPDGFTPALTWKARLTSRKLLPPGHQVSYGGIYTTYHQEMIGVIPVGYADGFRRVPGEQVLLHGKRTDVVGRVCMDQSMVQLDKVPEAQIGDEIVLLGSQMNERISAEEIADRWGTINYEVICGLSNRLPRVYIH